MDWNKYKDTVMQADKNVQAVVSNGKIDTSTVHFSNTGHVLGRQSRLLETFKRIGGAGKRILAVYLVDKGHSEGMELHWITENAVVIVTNALKQNGMDICTFIPARVGQLTRYPKGGAQGWSICERMFPDEEWTVPSELIEKAKRNERLGLNYTESAE